MNSFDADTFAQLVRDRGAALTLYARQWCEQPEDVVQEAFLQLSLQESWPLNVNAWLYRVVRNGAINAARGTRRRKSHERAAAESRERWFASGSDETLDASALQNALQSLDSDIREVVVAKLWGGLSFAEIGELTQASASSAFRRYHRGIAQLAERLSDEVDVENARKNKETHP